MNDEHQTHDSDLPAADCTQCAEYLDGWKRCKADYENLIKETERRRTETVAYANEELLTVLLPAIDQYETALAFTPDVGDLPEDARKRLKNWIIGLHAVRDLWEHAFRLIGLEKVPTDGAFDPAMHEAIERIEQAGIPPGHIVKTVTAGWKLREKLLRPAAVVVAQDPSV
ncbi:nucleotide exchange factor GrpE [Candidatus Uhrbacteria bacterium]|nr:nucleotide exchange factor GrpE [Candidatus Uhrbacteria bacterium]